MDTLFYGDNLEVLRAHVADASVDLVYLDPPFNSNASYNLLFRAPDGAGADASIRAFDDTWSWGPASSAALMDITQSGHHALHTLMHAMRTAIGENALMAYLAMMAVRLVELHRVLKPTGSLYLHCDPTASHYLKLLLDAVFGVENFRNEIVWKRTSAHNSARRWGPIHDTILFYSRSASFTWNRVCTAYDQAYLDRYYRQVDTAGRRYRLSDLTASGTRNGESGRAWNGFDPTAHGRHWAIPSIVKEDRAEAVARSPHQWLELIRGEGMLEMTGDGTGWPHVRRYLDRMPGQVLQDIVDDIPPLSKRHGERLGYPTQKPLALLERIIAASSDPGDVVLDPFCGCGTAVDAAQALGRRWLGIDVTHLAIGLIEKRLRERYGAAAQFETVGVPRDLASARRLAADDPHGFQQWITLQLGGYPWMGGRRGADRGVDGYFYYVGTGGQTETGVISVKAGGHVNPAMVRDLGRVMARDGHRIGLFVSAAAPTRGMADEANSHGLIDTEFGRFPALQIFTLAELFQDRHPRLPPLVSPTQRAPRAETRASHQPGAQGQLV